MALALFDRVQETTTTTGTGSITLDGAVPGFQSFAVVGNGNTCYYTIVDGSAWEVGTGTYSTSGPTLARTTVLSNSNGNTSPITLAAGTKSVFLTYPAGKSVNLNESGNVSPLGTVSSGVWQGSTVGVAYGGTGVTASSGANSVVLRDSNQNITVNRVNQSNTNTTAAGGTTALTAASSYIHTLVGTGNQTYTLPDATTLTTGVAFVFNNLATGTLTIANYAGTTVGTVPSGGAAAVFLTLNSTVGGTWDLHAYLPEGVTFGTNAFNLGTSIITGGTWQGGTIGTAYGGTGLTSYTSGGAVYANSSSTLTSGTLPTSAGGTGNTSGQAASTASSATFNSGGAGGASGSTFNGSGALTISYNTIGAPSVSGTNATGTWGISISGNAATATSATSATNATNATNLTGGTLSSSGGTVTGGIGISGSYTTYSGQALTIGSDASYAYIQSWGSRTLWLNPQGNSIIAGTGASPVLTSANYNSYAPTLTGTGATGTWAINISGNAATATLATSAVTLTSTQSNWNSTGVISNVVGMLAWKNYGNSHVIFDASAGTSPSGGAVNNTNPQNNWTGTYPTLMGWNGSNTYGVRVDSARVADSAGSTDYNALTNKTGGTGTYTTSGDYRAPIFYDSNDTSYYADLNGQSYMRYLRIAGDWGGSVDTAAFGIRGTYPSITFRSSTSNSVWLRHMDGAGDIQHYYASGGLDSNAWTVRHYMTSGGTFASIGDHRAPIFYDSDNTAYYVNPAGATSGSFAAFVGIGGNYGSDDGGWGARLNVGGTPHARLDVRAAGDGIITTMYSHNGQNRGFVGTMSNHRLALAVNGSEVQSVYSSYSESIGSYRAPIFYDSNDTGYYGDFASTSNLNALSVAIINNLAPKTDHWHTSSEGKQRFYFAPNSTTYYRTGGNFVWRNNADSGIMTSDGNGFLRVNSGGDNYASYPLHVTGTGYASGDFRAPIFYDSDDTGYYIDPNSTSNTALRMRGGALFGPNVTWGAYLAVGGNGHISGSYASVATTNGNLHMDASSGSSMYLNFYAGSTVNFGNGASSTVSSINTDGSHRATIFYDYNNTGYYGDFASTSNISDLVVRAGTAVANITDLTSGTAPIRVSNTGTGTTATRYIPMISGTSTSTSGYLQHTVFGSVRAAVWGSAFIAVGGNDSYPTVAYTFDYVGDGTAPSSWRAPIFYDSADTGYYLNPNGSSLLYGIVLSGNMYFRPNSWIQCDTSAGIYWPNHYGAHFYPNGGSTYTQLQIDGSKNSYSGMYISHSAVNGMMYDGGGNGGVYREANGRWYWYYLVANDCMGIGTSATSSTYSLYLSKGVFAQSRIDATIYYDTNNTGYYLDPASTSELNKVYYNSNMVSRNYGIGQIGLYASTRFQAVFSMGEAYILPADGTTAGNLYGIAWSYPSAGGVAANLNTHGALFLENGAFMAAVSGSIRCRDDMRAPIFYDQNNTAYYLDPNSITSLRTVGDWRADSSTWTGEFSGKMQYHANNWYLQFNSNMIFRRSDGTNVMTCDSGGNVTFTGNVTAYSDARLKENVVTIDSALDKVLNLRGVYYNKIGTPERRVGVIAQEIETVLPEVVRSVSDTNPSTGETQELLAVDYGNIAGLLIEATKEQNQEVVDLRNRVAQLESLIHKLIGD